MTIELQRASFMPSGIPAGSELSEPLRQSLANLAGVPLALQPVIEDGTYDEIKACVFRVLSYQVCEVAMKDIMLECRENGIDCQLQRREWKYCHPPLPKLFTTVQMRAVVSNRELDVSDFLLFLASKYEFRFNRMSVNHKQCTKSVLNAEYVFLDPSVEVDAEIVWPYWT